MVEHARIFLLYHHPTAGAQAQRLLATLDRTYPARTVMDVGFDALPDSPPALAAQLAADDVVLILLDPDWERQRTEGPTSGSPLDDEAFHPARTIRVGVRGARGNGIPVLGESTWDADVAGLLAVVSAAPTTAAEAPAETVAAPTAVADAPVAAAEAPSPPRTPLSDAPAARRPLSERPAARHTPVSDRQSAVRPGPGRSHERPQTHRRPRRIATERVLPIGAFLVTVLAIAIVLAVVLGNHSKRTQTSAALITTTVTTTSTRSSSLSSTTGPLAAVSNYWHAIGGHDFPAAYGYLAAGSVPQTESQWVADEQQSGIQSVQFQGRATGGDTSTAAVQVLSLVTRDTQFGCRGWTGSYQMVKEGGRWLIQQASITPGSCPGG